MPLWDGRFSKEQDSALKDFNSSIRFDSRMAAEDITGSIAHADMLGRCGIIESSEAAIIIDGLKTILAELESGALTIDNEAEDIHTFVEAELTKRVGNAGKRLHTARSRNDQVALDVRLYLKKQSGIIRQLLITATETLLTLAEKQAATVMPGYTHLQRAQPITFGHHLAAYAQMFLRDIGRMDDAVRRMNECPLGSGALAGTTYPIDRVMTAQALGFSGPTANSLDGVSDRDFCVELASALSLIMVHLSRLSEEIILWCSWEFKFIELDDAYSTGSSIMPQKKNPDIAELIRGKSGRVFGDLTALLTMLKGLPLAYNKDMQEDKEAIFDAFDTVAACLSIMPPMLSTMRVLPQNMRKAAAGGFINATDCADFLVGKGLPFREAYKITGRLVAFCLENGKALEEVTLNEYQSFASEFDDGIYNAINLEHCVNGRTVIGGPAEQAVKQQIDAANNLLNNIKNIKGN